MDDDLRKTLTSCIDNIQCLPLTSGMAAYICNSYFTSPIDLIRLTSLDPVLLGRLLHLANSFYDRPAQPVDSAARAIIILGMNTVKNLVISLLPENIVKNEKNNSYYDMYAFWQHSFCVAFTASFFAKKRGFSAEMAEKYFTAGFLHDIGKLLLFRTGEQMPGIDHCQSGELICENWMLENHIKDTIIHHHLYNEYSGEHKDILLSVAVSNYLVNSGDEEAVFLDICKKLGLSGDLVFSIYYDIKSTVEYELQKAELYLKSAGF